MPLSFQCKHSIAGAPPGQQPHLLPFLYLAFHIAQGAPVFHIIRLAESLRQFPRCTAFPVADHLPEPGGGPVQAVHVRQVHATVGDFHNHVAVAYPAEFQAGFRYKLVLVFHFVSEFLSRQDGEHRQEDDFRVKPQRAVVEVVQVHPQPLQHFLHRVRVAVIERGGREKAGAQLVQQLVVGVDGPDLVHEELALRARTDKAHLALEHVPQLRELVQMVLAQETPHTGQTFVALPAAQCRPAVRLRRGDHGTELVERENLPVIAHTFLPEDGFPAVLALYGDVDDQEHRREDEHPDDARHEVQAHLYPAGAGDTTPRRQALPSNAASAALDITFVSFIVWYKYLLRYQSFSPW